MEAEIEKTARKKITLAQAALGKKIAEATASGDLGGDPKFSGWKPPLDTQVKHGMAESTILLPTRSGAGPWTVAQYGRNNHGNAKGFQGPGIGRNSGVTLRTKKGKVRKVRAVAAKRWNGVTIGKHTATKAIVRIDIETPKIADLELRRTITRYFDVD